MMIIIIIIFIIITTTTTTTTTITTTTTTTTVYCNISCLKRTSLRMLNFHNEFNLIPNIFYLIYSTVLYLFQYRQKSSY